MELESAMKLGPQAHQQQQQPIDAVARPTATKTRCSAEPAPPTVAAIAIVPRAAAAAAAPLPSYPSSYASSPCTFPSSSNLEEGGDESGTDSVIEPVTPVSCDRCSQDFIAVHHADFHLNRDQSASHPPAAAPKRTAPLITQTSAPPRLSDSDPSPQTPPPRRSVRDSTGKRLRRTVSNLFRRTSSTEKVRELGAAADAPPPFDPSLAAGLSAGLAAGHFTGHPAGLSAAGHSAGLSAAGHSAGHSAGHPAGLSASLSTRRPRTSHRFHSSKSSSTNRSDSPPSPTSPLQMIPTHRAAGGGDAAYPAAAASSDDFGKEDFRKKGRATTGFTLRGHAVHFGHHAKGGGRGFRPASSERRASSFDGGDRAPHLGAAQAKPAAGDEGMTYPPERLPWPLPPDAGTGVKARRMSLSLPDDFNVDVADLQSEYEYQHKILGRHGKHLGKGAASRVTLMVRKGCPGELYAVKEFRGKSHRESQAEYEKKIKSEFSIAKSLHHPNIVETMRLCTNHHRWNHVMEYCSEGDLFGLVQKGHLKGEDKKKDRLCLFKQLVQGVGYLHANGIAHRDIKLENLLLTKDSKLKITDFGVSEVFSGTHPGLRESGGQCGRNMGETRLCSPGICGSEPYIAPEVLEKRERYDARALDVWSSAIVMIYLTFGGAIWARAERGQPHYDKLVQGWERWNEQHPSRDAAITESDYPNCLALDVGVNPPALRRLLLQMLNPDPRRRMAIVDVLGNRWMRNVECCQVESYEDQAQLIDATKKEFCGSGRNGARKIFCHNHLPSKTPGSHSLGKMPGQTGY